MTVEQICWVVGCIVVGVALGATVEWLRWKAQTYRRGRKKK